MEHLVSVGVPVFNGENYVRQCLDSLLAQTYSNIEIVICDNASTDSTERICLSYASLYPQIRYFRNPENLGALANYNLTFELSSGEYFKWAAHDDVCHETFIERCVEVLQNNPECELCFPSMRNIDAEGKLVRQSRPGLGIDAATPDRRIRQLLELEMASNDIFWSVFGVMRRKTLERIGVLRDHVASDQTFLLTLVIEGKFLEVDEALYSRREHEGNSTSIKQYSDRRAWYLGKHTSRRIVLPNLRLCAEHIRIVHSAGFGFWKTLSLKSTICRRFLGRWRFILREVASIPTQLLHAMK
jgi:glycosyltransferase involved in cell wall biosynthesis